MRIVSAAVPANVKAEAVTVLAARDISMAALVRELLIRVVACDTETLAWLDQGARR